MGIGDSFQHYCKWCPKYPDGKVGNSFQQYCRWSPRYPRAFLKLATSVFNLVMHAPNCPISFLSCFVNSRNWNGPQNQESCILNRGNGVCVWKRYHKNRKSASHGCSIMQRSRRTAHIYKFSTCHYDPPPSPCTRLPPPPYIIHMWQKKGKKDYHLRARSKQ